MRFAQNRVGSAAILPVGCGWCVQTAAEIDRPWGLCEQCEPWT
jgi:hypothetical protein